VFSEGNVGNDCILGAVEEISLIFFWHWANLFAASVSNSNRERIPCQWMVAFWRLAICRFDQPLLEYWSDVEPSQGSTSGRNDFKTIDSLFFVCSKCTGEM